MKALRQVISARIKAVCASVKYVNTWNNQVGQLSEGEQYAFRMPAVFVEILDNEIHTLGNGNQIYDPLDIVLHIVHREDKSINMDENLNVEDVRQEVYAAFHKWATTGTGLFFRVEEQRDYEHTNVYHLLITFRTTYVDSSLNEPRQAVILDPPFDIDVQADFVDEL